MNWLRNWLADRRLKREWDEMFYVGALWAYTWKHLSDHLLFDHHSLSCYDVADHDAHVAAHQELEKLVHNPYTGIVFPKLR